MAKKVAESGMLVALAMIFSYVETLIPFNFGVPGMKLGLANLAVVTALYLMGAGQAFMISLLRILLISITFGNMSAMMYSLAGGMLSFGAMALLAGRKGFSVVGVSVLGGAMHNVGQLLAAALVVENFQVIYYLPPLLAGGVVTGLLIGLAAGRILPPLKKFFRNEDSCSDAAVLFLLTCVFSTCILNPEPTGRSEREEYYVIKIQCEKAVHRGSGCCSGTDSGFCLFWKHDRRSLSGHQLSLCGSDDHLCGGKSF